MTFITKFLQASGLYNLITIYRKSRIKYHHFKLGKYAPRPGEIIHVDPRDIRGHLEHKKKGWPHLIKSTGYEEATVYGGNWDKDYITYLDFTKQEVFKSCYQHWVKGIPWDKTPIYMDYVTLIESGVPNRFKSLEDLSQRYQELDKIFAMVKKNKALSDDPDHLIRISMARDGTLIWGPNGRHRICMAICADIKTIPAKVGYVHSEAVDIFNGLRDI